MINFFCKFQAWLAVLQFMVCPPPPPPLLPTKNFVSRTRSSASLRRGKRDQEALPRSTCFFGAKRNRRTKTVGKMGCWHVWICSVKYWWGQGAVQTCKRTIVPGRRPHHKEERAGFPEPWQTTSKIREEGRGRRIPGQGHWQSGSRNTPEMVKWEGRLAGVASLADIGRDMWAAALHARGFSQWKGSGY